MRESRWTSLILVLFAACLVACTAFPAYPADDPEDEVKIGKKAAEEVAKESEFVEDPALMKRVESIGNAIAKIANEKEIPASYGKSTITKFDYSFKIIEDKDVNAFALPGGFVYVNKGLLDYVQSDDELAGVIAHEIAHVSHHHAIQSMKAQQKEMTKVILAVLVGAAAGAGMHESLDLAYALNLIAIAKLNGYGQKAESDADRTAVAYMADSKYSPVGMLTFMERLARDEIRKPQVNYGIFTTHPPSHKRAHEMIDEIQKRGITVNRRQVTKYVQVEVKPIEDLKASAVWIGDTEVIRLADSGGERAAARAERVADKLSSLLLAGARLLDVKLGGGGRYVVLMGEILVAPTPEDAELAGTSVTEVTTSVANAIKKALLKEMLDRKY